MRIAVTERIFGPVVETGMIPVEYRDPARWYYPQFDSIASAWREVQFPVTAPVAVVLALKGTDLFVEGPVIVSTDEKGLEAMRRVVALFNRLEADPRSASAEAAALHGKPDGVLAGAVYAYVTEKTEIVDPDLRESVLEQMIANPSIPKVLLREVLLELLAIGERALPPTHRGALKTLLDLALSSDVETCAAGLEALARFRERRDQIETLTPPPVKAKLAASYRALVQGRKLARQAFLEDLLGVDSQPQSK